jgi:ABC-type uncharacterized transport system ATPase subunit
VIVINEGSLVYDGPTSEINQDGESMNDAFERLTLTEQAVTS